jgi:hypothetical protein
MRALQIAVYDSFERLASTTSRTFAFLHAGAVEIAGQAVLFPGASHAGKSTLVAALLKEGGRYLSDDMVAIDRRLRAHRFATDLGLRPLSGGLPRRTSMRDLGARAAERPVPVALIWSGTYNAQTIRPSFKRRRGLEAFAALVPHSPGLRTQPRVALPILRALAERVPIFCGLRCEVDEMVNALLRRLEQTSAGAKV